MVTLHTKVRKLIALKNLIIIITQSFNLTLKGWSSYMQISCATIQKLSMKETRV
jgi:hypothetical protein